MPVGIEQYGRFFRRFEFRLVDVTNGFLSDIVIQFFTLVVESIDIRSDTGSRAFLVGCQ